MFNVYFSLRIEYFICFFFVFSFIHINYNISFDHKKHSLNSFYIEINFYYSCLKFQYHSVKPHICHTQFIFRWWIFGCYWKLFRRIGKRHITVRQKIMMNRKNFSFEKKELFYVLNLSKVSMMMQAQSKLQNQIIFKYSFIPLLRISWQFIMSWKITLFIELCFIWIAHKESPSNFLLSRWHYSAFNSTKIEQISCAISYFEKIISSIFFIV